jgi:threonine synthase
LVGVCRERITPDHSRGGRLEGLFVAPEGAACFAALQSMLASKQIGADEQVVIFNTGSGIKYLDCYGE